jgi:hypothetical protein
MYTGSVVLLIALLALSGAAAAQTQPGQDAINRNLQQRAVEERALSLGLDERPPPPRPMGPEEIKRSITLPTPGTEILQRQPPPAVAPGPRVVVPAPPVPSSQELLDDSQRRRQLELQTQLPSPTSLSPTPADDAIRQQQQQVQQLQFEREQRAGSLGSDIMRNSDRAMGR